MSNLPYRANQFEVEQELRKLKIAHTKIELGKDNQGRLRHVNLTLDKESSRILLHVESFMGRRLRVDFPHLEDIYRDVHDANPEEDKGHHPTSGVKPVPKAAPAVPVPAPAPVVNPSEPSKTPETKPANKVVEKKPEKKSPNTIVPKPLEEEKCKIDVPKDNVWSLSAADLQTVISKGDIPKCTTKSTTTKTAAVSASKKYKK